MNRLHKALAVAIISIGAFGCTGLLIVGFFFFKANFLGEKISKNSSHPVNASEQTLPISSVQSSQSPQPPVPTVAGVSDERGIYTVSVLFDARDQEIVKFFWGASSFFKNHFLTSKSPKDQISNSAPLSKVAGASDEKLHDDIPLSFESREHATEVRPIRKEGVYDLVLSSPHASVVMDAESGAVLQEKSAHERRQIASLTKLMTAMLVVERVQNLDESATIDSEIISTEGTRVGCPRSGFCNGVRLHVGEKISVRNLLKATLMNSANDAALALAKHVAGSAEAFVEIMNSRARSLGLSNTHFCTPSGLEPDGRESECYSSAFDIAHIASQALKYDIIWDLARTPGDTITSVDGKYAHDIFNTDVLLGEYPGLVGAKTGFTPLAGYSLLAISFDSDQKHKIVSVVLNDPERWSSVKKMFAWAFQSHYWR